MKQPHTEQTVRHTDDQQNTGNHPKPSAKQPRADTLGGTRAGAENVEESGNNETTPSAHGANAVDIAAEKDESADRS